MQSQTFNLLITKRCNKKCSFCFAGEKLKGHEMTLEFAERIIDGFPDIGNVNVLGGEPTIADNFKEIMEMIHQKGKSIKLISNLLFDDEMADWLIEFKGKYPNVIVLANAMDLTDKNVGTFVRNYNKLTEKAFIMSDNPPNGISLAFTIAEHYEEDHFRKYAKWLLDNGLEPRYPRLRVGLDLTGEWVINNKIIGRQIADLYTVLHKNPKTLIFFDCKVPPCIFDFNDRKTMYMLDNYTDVDTNAQALQQKPYGDKFVTGCLKPITDINDKGEAFYCYPTEKITLIDDAFKFDSILNLNKELSNLYMDNVYSKGKKIPKECNDCSMYGVHCNGLCLACYAEDGNETENVLIPIKEVKN